MKLVKVYYAGLLFIHMLASESESKSQPQMSCMVRHLIIFVFFLLFFLAPDTWHYLFTKPPPHLSDVRVQDNEYPQLRNKKQTRNRQRGASVA